MNRHRVPIPHVAALALVAWTSACDEPPRATTVRIHPSSVEMTSLAATRQLTAEVLDQYGAVMPGIEATWSSSAPMIAEVFATGLVRAVGNGTGTITATASDLSGTAAVKVMQAASSVRVQPSTDSVEIADTVRFGAEALDENGYPVEGADFTWSSSNDSVATVDESGLARGVSDGTATITATAEAVGGSARVVVLHRDWVALRALYRATTGANWRNSENWLTGAPMGDWYGVTTEGGNVTVLDLTFNGLVGPIPPELGDLADARVLDLRSNAISGPIPPELGNLANLRRLDFGGYAFYAGRLSGPIPPELGNLVNLRILDFGSNTLAGPVPAGFGRMSRLRELVLSNNAEMAGPLPSELTALSRLELLMAGGTELCASTNADVQAWLDGIHKRRIAPCVSALPAAYLTQAAQSRMFPVPLVKDRKALLRVFVTAHRATDEGIPPVRARFYVDGEETHVEKIPAKSTPIPTAVDEGSLSRSANAEIPADVIEPGLEMVIEVDPDGTLEEGLLATKRIPETGRLAVDVREMPVLDLTAIPFVWRSTHDSSIVDVVEAMADDPDDHTLLWDTRTWLPIGDLEVTAHAPVLSTSNNAFDLLSQTVAIRAMEGRTGHYKGIMAPPVTGAGGVAYRPGRSSFSQPRGYILAHELGHNLSLHHAPCGGAGGPDPSYPYRDGSIGVWGYDFRGDSLTSPPRPDLMSYCGPRWISDFHFTNALRFRLSDADSAGLPYLGPRKSLLLWGGMGADSVPFLEPAFVVEAPPSPPQPGGEYRLTGRSGGGVELFSLSFGMPEVADGDGSSSFAFTIPAHPGWEQLLGAITLSGPGGSATLDAGSDRAVVILRDPRSGQVRAILHDVPELDMGQGDVGAALGAGPGLEVLFSRGIPDPAEWRR